MNIYALLVGINQYHSAISVPPLNGCANDVRMMRQFLEKHFMAAQLHCKTLVDEAATRHEIISCFGTKHLLKAGKGDIVLFQFSGHGARGTAAKEFLTHYPDGMDENLICYDSRIPGGLDLADKELAVLIDRIAQKGATVVVLLDCCHSGSGTRNLADLQLGAARNWEDRTKERTLSSYLDGYFLNRKKILPNAKHILLAACEKREKAYELPSNRGNFSHHLVTILEECKGKINYADLFTQCRIRMRKISDQQNPQFETFGYFNAFSNFLSLSGDQSSAAIQLFFQDHQWQVNVGVLNGLPTDVSQKTSFAVYHENERIGYAKTQLVGLEQSSVELDFDEDQNKIYTAKMISLPGLTLPIHLIVMGAGREKIDAALSNYRPIYFKLVEDFQKTLYELQVEENKVQIRRREDQLIIQTFDGNDEQKIFETAFKGLEQLAKWEKTLTLDNRNTRMNREEVQLLFVELDGQGQVVWKTTDQEILVDIFIQNKIEQKVPFRLEAINNHPTQERYCSLFYMSASYGVHKVYNENIPPLSQVILMEHDSKGQAYAFELKGKPEALDIFKLIVSQQKISDYMLTQLPLSIGITKHFWKTKKGEDQKRDADEDSLKARFFGFEEASIDELATNDWYVQTMKIKSVAQLAKVGVQEITLADGIVKIRPYQGDFKADVGLGHEGTQHRNLESVAILPQLAEAEKVEMLYLAPASKMVKPPNVLVLNNLLGTENLQQHPLEIELDISLEESEELLPITFDGQHILPIGKVWQEENKTLIAIHHLPEIYEERKRSLCKSIKLCFMKLLLDSKKVAKLCWVDYSQTKIVRRSENLSTKVEKADHILLLIHGIVGDTSGMAECMRLAYEAQNFDLILSFDYENLHTPIDKTALDLSQLLPEAGISATQNKKITILAHSMGGLVARYFIEKLNGNAVVKQLIMAGTPNAGSIIAKLMEYRDWATVLMGFAVNSAWGIPAVAVILSILKKSELLTQTLDQMNGDKIFIQQLNRSTYPGVPYHIIAGHLDRYLQKNIDAKSLMDKIYKGTAKLFYQQEPNDIAVNVKSILHIPEAWQPQVKEVACHHLNYFLDQESVRVLYEILQSSKASR